MKKYIRPIIAIVLALIMLSGTGVTAFSANANAELATVYDDGMLFKQNDSAIIRGTAVAGTKITCKLVDSKGNTIRTAEAVTNADSKFSVSFTAPDGGYEHYKIIMSANGEEFRTINDVLFGELWLASGQSNMAYQLGFSDTYDSDKTYSDNLRFLYVDPYPTYKGDPLALPFEPQTEIEEGSCQWIKGSAKNISAISAVSFFFAQKLQKDLDVPVGVLVTNLGGSSIQSWISREEVDSNPELKQYYKDSKSYISERKWDRANKSEIGSMTVNYNKKIPPLRDFRISGMIWYQGESEMFGSWNYGIYSMHLEALQRSYGKLFNFDGKLPLVFTQLASLDYAKASLPTMNFEYTQFQKESPDSRAVITQYDVPVGYYPTSGSAHPYSKQPIGERMAYSAEGLVYKQNDCYTAPTIDSYRIDGEDVYVKIANVCNGLMVNGDELKGFALCEDGGVYVQAEAEIVSKDTVKIHSDEVKNPVAATYAFARYNNRSNLFSTSNGELLMPVSPFTTDLNQNKNYWQAPAWADCDSQQDWMLDLDYAGYYDAWDADSANANVTADDAFSGQGGLNIKSDSTSFGVSPRFKLTTITGKIGFFNNVERDWSNYSQITVMVRNNGKSDTKLDKLQIFRNGKTWYAPLVNGTYETGCVIPADGEWHKITFDINSLYRNGNDCGAIYSRRKLSEIDSFKLCFENEDGSANISLDEFRFTADSSKGRLARWETDFSRADTVFEYISAIFVKFIGFFANIFKF